MNTKRLILAAASGIAATPALAIEVEVPSASYPTLGVALNLASTNSIDTITLLDQQPGDAADFIGSFDLTIAGRPITLRGEAGANVIIDAFGTGSVLEVKSNSLDGTLVQNLTLRNGQSLRGGGIDFNANADLFLENVRFIDNGSNAFAGPGTTDRGGAISCGAPAAGSGVTGGRLFATDCLFQGNDAQNFGGAIYTNTYPITLDNCVFDDNATPRVPLGDAVPATGLGGAIFMNGAPLIVDGTTFSNNFCAQNGGAVYISSSSSGVFRTTVFDSNEAGRTGSPQGRGAGYYSTDGRPVNAVNCLFINNTSEYFGPAIYTIGNSDIVHCTFAGNQAANGGASAINVPSAGLLRLRNSILTGATDSIDGTGSVTIAHSNYAGSPGLPGAPTANGTFEADPMFANAAGGDYRLMPGSPCIDAGDSLTDTGSVTQVDILTDFDGANRGVADPDTPNTGVSVWEVCVDMGAFELQADCGSVNDCVGDVNTSNVNPGDPGYGEPDGKVDGADLSYYVEQWLAGCP